jgi:predicted membrane-bound spermidine synthase
MSSAAVYLLLAAAVAGGGGMALEMAASRLLQPYYGDSHLIWANLIGLILAALTVGYYVGGILADKRPTRRALSALLALSGLWTLLLPLVAAPLLGALQRAFPVSQLGFIVSSLIGVLLLFAPPTFLLGCVSPYAIRLSLPDVASAGNVAGSVYAVSTVGSMVGTFAAALWLMPSYGLRATFAVVAVVLLATAALGLALLPRRSATASRATG